MNNAMYERIDIYLSENNVRNKINEIDKLSKLLSEKYVYELNNFVWKGEAKKNFVRSIEKLQQKLSNCKKTLNNLLNTIKDIEKIQLNLKRIKVLEEENNSLNLSINQNDKQKIIKNLQEIDNLNEINNGLNNTIMSQWG